MTVEYRSKEQERVGQEIERLCNQGKNDQAMHVLRKYYGGSRVDDFFDFDALDKSTSIELLETDMGDESSDHSPELCRKKLNMVKSHDDKMYFGGDDLTDFCAMNGDALINALLWIPDEE